MGAFPHNEVTDCAAYIRRALAACWPRPQQGTEWVEDELRAVCLAANEWAVMHDRNAVTLEEVKALDSQACGHIDWARKLPWYVAERVYGLTAHV